jgi:hypothetical protein
MQSGVPFENSPCRLMAYYDLFRSDVFISGIVHLQNIKAGSQAARIDPGCLLGCLL